MISQDLSEEDEDPEWFLELGKHVTTLFLQEVQVQGNDLVLSNEKIDKNFLGIKGLFEFIKRFKQSPREALNSEDTNMMQTMSLRFLEIKVADTKLIDKRLSRMVLNNELT
jgi:hypothetical protein